MVQSDSSRNWAMSYTAALIPAFFWIQYDGRLAFLWIRYKHIHLAYFYTDITSVAEIGIEYYRPIWGSYIRSSIYLFFTHDDSLLGYYLLWAS